MDDDDRESNASSEREADRDLTMQDVDEPEPDPEGEGEDAENENDENDDADMGEDAEPGSKIDENGDSQGSGDHRNRQDAPKNDNATTSAPEGDGNKVARDGDVEVTEPTGPAAAGSPKAKAKSPTPKSEQSLRPEVVGHLTMRQEAIVARSYDIVPTMAAPQSTSINALAITPDMRFWMTGGADGYIRKYDGADTINGKQLLTVAQRHPFVDSVTKACVLMSYWENEEPPPPNSRGNEEPILSPVYSLAIQSNALWLLSGLESGGINLQSVRHDEGKRIHYLREHTNAVSAMVLAPDEKSFLSGSWDKTVLDWDLNTGQVRRKYEGSGGQISAIEQRPAIGVPIPADTYDQFMKTETFWSNNGKEPSNGIFLNGVNGYGNYGKGSPPADLADAQPSPAHESLFGGSDPGSLFGEGGGGGLFGGEDDTEFSNAMDMTLHGDSHEGGMDHSADAAMALDPEVAPPPAVQSPPEQPPVADASVPGAQGTTDTTMANGVSEHQANGVVDSAELPAPDINGVSVTTEGTLIGDQPPPLPSTDAPLPLARRSDPPSPRFVFASHAPGQPVDPSQVSDWIFTTASIDGTIRVWDRRVPDPVARIANRPGVPPWCMGLSWSPDGNRLYAGRRNGIVEEFDIHQARSGWEAARTFKLPPGSGPVSALRVMPNSRHLIVASHDILRLYDIGEGANAPRGRTPFLIVPGPPRPGVISALWLDPTGRFLVSAAGTRGWEGTCTESIVGYEIGCVEPAA